jgi:hypothetical protein
MLKYAVNRLFLQKSAFNIGIHEYGFIQVSLTAVPMVAHGFPNVAHGLPMVAHSYPSVAHGHPSVAHSLPMVAHGLPYGRARSRTVAHARPVHIW